MSKDYADVPYGTVPWQGGFKVKDAFEEPNHLWMCAKGNAGIGRMSTKYREDRAVLISL